MPVPGPRAPRWRVACASALLLVAAAGVARTTLPDARAVQSAYDDAKLDPDSNPQHVDELHITTAQCTALAGVEQFACQIDFVRRAEPEGRLYFDVVTLEDRAGRWVLLSGLCKSRPARR
jgi:hypothetical protein